MDYLHILLNCICIWSCCQAFWFKRERCCSEVNGACFAPDSMYRNAKLPQCFLPDFHLHTRMIDQRDDNHDGIPISADNIPDEFTPELRTVVIIHGWNDGPNEWAEPGESWVYQLKDALLDEDDMNVIVADWSTNARTHLVNYLQAAANTRVCGKAVNDLFETFYGVGLEHSRGWCIGHSLGAHVCGYAGKYNTFGRITGLDPAGPGFEKLTDEARLSKNDADFVDVIHTDGGGFALLDYGTLIPMGDVDFYPNGGKKQSGCDVNKRKRRHIPEADDDDIPVLTPVRVQRDLRLAIGETTIANLGCSHMRAVGLFINSISSSCFRATSKCFVATQKFLGFCINMKTAGALPLMGYRADTTARGMYHVTTSDVAPFCPGSTGQDGSSQRGVRRRNGTRPRFNNGRR